MLFNEPKLLKCKGGAVKNQPRARFSALQRAEIAEIERRVWGVPGHRCFSALQRAEIAEIKPVR